MIVRGVEEEHVEFRAVERLRRRETAEAAPDNDDARTAAPFGLQRGSGCRAAGLRRRHHFTPPPAP
jgi:hypothetical protein